MSALFVRLDGEERPIPIPGKGRSIVATIEVEGHRFELVMLDEREYGNTTDPVILLFVDDAEEPTLTLHPLNPEEVEPIHEEVNR